jgi:hypothetical protein
VRPPAGGARRHPRRWWLYERRQLTAKWTRRYPRVRAGLGKVFLGDWHPVLRDPLDLFRLSFLVGALVFALVGDGHAAAQLVLTAGAVFVARIADVPRLFDWGFCAAMAFNGWGDALRLFENFWWYDNVVHINLPCFLAVLLYIGLSRLGVVPDPATQAKRPSWLVGMALITFCIGVTMASFYEIYEWVVDHWFAQHLAIGETDTITDLADGFLGAAIGGLLLAAWATGELPTRRTQRKWTVLQNSQSRPSTRASTR